jgi:hypothetical protein
MPRRRASVKAVEALLLLLKAQQFQASCSFCAVPLLAVERCAKQLRLPDVPATAKDAAAALQARRAEAAAAEERCGGARRG